MEIRPSRFKGACQTNARDCKKLDFSCRGLLLRSFASLRMTNQVLETKGGGWNRRVEIVVAGAAIAENGAQQ